MTGFHDRIMQKDERYFILVILLIALLVYLGFIYRTSFFIDNERFFTLIDDAMISMRYAKHLANGEGLVWNIGEAPIQGFTNLGWTLYMSLLHNLPVSESKISFWVMLTESFLLLGNACIAIELSKKIQPKSVIAPFTTQIITLLYFPLVFWSLRGMEVGITTLLVSSLALLAIKPDEFYRLRRSLLIGVIIFLLVLVRLDSILQVSLIVFYILFTDSGKLRENRRHKFMILLFFIFSISSILLFQLLYFDSLLPNTYYLKVEGASFAERINVGLQAFVEYASRDILAPLFVILFGLFLFKDLRKKQVWLLLMLFFIQCLYSLYVGGDYAEPLSGGWYVDAANRFIVQGMPFLFVIFGIVLDRIILNVSLVQGKSPIVGFRAIVYSSIMIGLVTLIMISGEPWFKWSIYNSPGLSLDINKARLGIHIRENTDENAVIAVHGAGQIPYYSELATIDLLGKNDPVVGMGNPARHFVPGHNKWNYEYSISTLLPDVIADEWGVVRDYLSTQPEYTRLENGIWFRDDSLLVNIEGLAKNYQ